MEIETRTIYDRKAAKAFMNVSMYGSTNPNKRFLFSLMLDSVLIILSVLLGLLSGFTTLIWICLCIGLLFLLFLFMIHFLMPILAYRNLAKTKDIVHYCTFFDTEMFFSSSNELVNGESRVKYEALTKAIETKAYLFLYITNNQAYLIDKSLMSEAEIIAVRSVLQAKLGSKYTACRY